MEDRSGNHGDIWMKLKIKCDINKLGEKLESTDQNLFPKKALKWRPRTNHKFSGSKFWRQKELLTGITSFYFWTYSNITTI